MKNRDTDYLKLHHIKKGLVYLLDMDVMPHYNEYKLNVRDGSCCCCVGCLKNEKVYGKRQLCNKYFKIPSASFFS